MWSYHTCTYQVMCCHRVHSSWCIHLTWRKFKQEIVILRKSSSLRDITFKSITCFTPSVQESTASSPGPYFRSWSLHFTSQIMAEASGADFEAMCIRCLHLTPKPEHLASVRQVYEGRDAFVWLPTGYGKSLCYQVYHSFSIISTVVPTA